MEFDFAGTLGRAWKITWNHKILWLFGILASCGQWNGGSNTNYNVGSEDFQGAPADLPPWLQRFGDGLQEGDPAMISIVIGLVCLGLLISLAFVALSVIGRGGLIGGVRLAAAENSVTFSQAWGEGTRHFWTLFLIGLVVGLTTLIVVLVTIIPGAILTGLTAGVGLICLLPIVCVVILFAIALSILAYFAQIAAVLENLGVSDSLRRAWEIIRANIGPIIVLGILLAVIGGIASFVTALPLIALVFPIILGMAGFASERQVLGTAGIGLAAICFIAYLPVLLLASGILQTWTTAAWTLAYQRFSAPKPTAGPMPAPTPTPFTP